EVAGRGPLFEVLDREPCPHRGTTTSQLGDGTGHTFLCRNRPALRRGCPGCDRCVATERRSRKRPTGPPTDFWLTRSGCRHPTRGVNRPRPSSRCRVGWGPGSVSGAETRRPGCRTHLGVTAGWPPEGGQRSGRGGADGLRELGGVVGGVGRRRGD